MQRSERLTQALKFAIVSIMAIVLVYTPVIWSLMPPLEGRHVTIPQAFIFVLQTITTVGYGSFLPFQSWVMNLLAALLMISGISMVFFVVTNLVAHWVNEAISPTPDTETDMEDHLIFTAYNSLVGNFMESLEEREIPFIVLSGDEQEALLLEEDEDVDVVYGRPDDTETLEKANIDEARGLIACGSDADNITTVLAAKGTSKTTAISLVETHANSRYPMLAGADEVLSPKRSMGRALVDWALAIPTPANWPPPIEVEEGADVIKKLNPSVFYITEGSPLSEKKIRDIGEMTGALIVGMWQGDDLILNPDPDEEALGAALIALGNEEDVRELAEMASSEEEGRGDVVIAGFGDVGNEALDRLETVGLRPTVIDQNDPGLDECVTGDATDLSVLKEAGVDEADDLVIALNNDSATVQTALEARSMNPGIHMAARAMHDDSLEKFSWAGVDHPLSIPTVSARMLLQATVGLGIIEPPSDAVAARRKPKDLVGESVTSLDVRRKTGCLIVGIVREDEVLPVDVSEVLHEGDELLLIGSKTGIEKFERDYL